MRKSGSPKPSKGTKISYPPSAAPPSAPPPSPPSPTIANFHDENVLQLEFCKKESVANLEQIVADEKLVPFHSLQNGDANDGREIGDSQLVRPNALCQLKQAAPPPPTIDNFHDENVLQLEFWKRDSLANLEQIVADEKLVPFHRLQNGDANDGRQFGFHN